MSEGAYLNFSDLPTCGHCGHIIASEDFFSSERLSCSGGVVFKWSCPVCSWVSLTLVPVKSPVPSASKQISKNTLCPCGSGKRFKKCCRGKKR